MRPYALAIAIVLHLAGYASRNMGTRMEPIATPLLRATQLRCEYKINPLGIDVRQPRLTWLLESDQPRLRNQRQTAYRILVASTRENLERNTGDLWDSGKVDSDETANVAYAGQALRSEQPCWWKVRVWNGDSAASDGSE